MFFVRALRFWNALEINYYYYYYYYDCKRMFFRTFWGSNWFRQSSNGALRNFFGQTGRRPPKSDCARTPMRTDILQWKAHILRSINQEAAKQDQLGIITNNATYALIVMDWEMKFLQLKYREKKSDWYGKKGLSWHISTVISSDPDKAGSLELVLRSSVRHMSAGLVRRQFDDREHFGNDQDPKTAHHPRLLALGRSRLLS